MNPRDSAEEVGVGVVERPLGTSAEEQQEVASAASAAMLDDNNEDKAPSFDCNVCGRSFPFQSSLSQHMRRHTGARPYKCPYCDHRASQKGNLKVHIRSHKLGVLIKEAADPDPNPDPDHPDDSPEDMDMESEETTSREGSVSEGGLEGGNSPTKSSSACNGVLNGGGPVEGAKMASRGTKRERSGSVVEASKPLCCRLCGHVVQREDQLLSHIEKAHITADVDSDEASSLPATTAAVQEAPVAEPEVEEFTCDTCGQSFAQAWLLKAHVKKHTGELEHRCRICGRGFRETWFLKSHMKTHAGPKSSGRGRPRNSSSSSSSNNNNSDHSLTAADQPRATINDVPQDPEVAAAQGAVCLYEICSKCGNLFHNRQSLAAHSRVHSSRQTPRNHQASKLDHTLDEDSPAAKRRLLDYLCLQPAEERPKEERQRGLGKRVPELDPMCSYQAWQLASRGRVVEPVGEYRRAEWDDNLAAATVTYDRESSRYVLAGQERKSSRRGSSTGGGGGVSGGQSSSSPKHERSIAVAAAATAADESLSDSEYRPSSRQERRRSSQSRSSHECFECGKVFRSRHQLSVHERSHRREGGGGRGSGGDADSRSPSRPSTPAQNDSPCRTPTAKQQGPPRTSTSTSTEEKPYVCSLCDFVTPDSSVFISHLRQTHPEPSVVQEPAAPKSTPTPVPTPTPTVGHHPSGNSRNSSSSTPSSYPKLKRALLQGASPSPSPSRSPSERPPALPNAIIATHARPLSPVEECEPAVDLCVRPDGPRGGPVSPSSSALDATGTVAEEPASHRCSYCSHRTRYPEVLWMHQMIAHRLNSSALVPKWAPKNAAKKSSDLRRRTGPPPALEGKECPPLAAAANVRSFRTRPPTTTTSSTSSSAVSSGQKRDRPSSSSSSTSQSSSSSSSSSSSGQPRSGTSSVAAKVPRLPTTSRQHQETPSPRSRPRVDVYPRVTSSGALEKNAGGTPHPHSHSHHNHHHHHGSSNSGGGSSSSSSSTVNPSASPRPGARMADRFLLPQEGLGFMLSSKHGLSEYGRPKSSSSSPSSSSSSSSPAPQAAKAKGVIRSQPSHNNTTLPTTHPVTSTTSAATAIANHLYGASQPHGGAALLGLGSPSALRSGEAKQETLAAAAAAAAAATGTTADTQLDILSFLKNCNSQELATLYHRWGMANPLLEHTGLLRSLARQGEYACQECGKSFSQPSHLRTHMRSHTGERPFRCHLCPYRASQKGNLKTHVQSVHHVPFDNTTTLHLDAALTKMEQLSSSQAEVHTPQSSQHPHRPHPQQQQQQEQHQGGHPPLSH